MLQHAWDVTKHPFKAGMTENEPRKFYHSIMLRMPEHFKQPIGLWMGYDSENLLLSLSIPKEYPDLKIEYVFVRPMSQKSDPFEHKIYVEFADKKVAKKPKCELWRVEAQSKREDVMLYGVITTCDVLTVSVPRHDEIKHVAQSGSEYFFRFIVKCRKSGAQIAYWGAICIGRMEAILCCVL